MGKIVKWLFLAVVIASMCACTSDDVNAPSPVENSVVNFSFFDASVEEFRPGTRADDDATKSWKQYFKRLDIAIFPTGETKNADVVRLSQLSSATNFGALTERLPIGSYIMVAVANKGEDSVAISSSVLATFQGGRVSDMAYCYVPFEVKSGTNAVNGSLKRALTKFTLQATDMMPADISKVEIKYMGHTSLSFNPSTGFGTNSTTQTTQTVTFNMPNVQLKTAPGYSFYTLIPEETQTVTVEVNVYNSQNTVVKSLQFDSVVLQQNHITTYTGPLFTSGTSFDFSFDNKALGKSEYNKDFGDDGTIQ